MIDPQGNDLSKDEVYPVKMGIFNMWVCAPKHMTQEQVQEAVDQMEPSGTTAGWQVQLNGKEEPEPALWSPGFCQEDENRQHWNCHC